MAMWGSRKQQAAKVTGLVWYVHPDGGDYRKAPKGYIPIVLVGDSEDNEGGHQRVLINIKMLREPCIAALLEMAEQQFGHGQSGVLRIPCSLTHFEQMVNAMISKAERQK